MTPTRAKKTGRPSKGERHKFRISVPEPLKALVKAQAAAEGKYEDTLLVAIVMEHWPNWSTRSPLTEETILLLTGPRTEELNVRVPVTTADEIFVEAGDGPAVAIVAELIARYLPERIERFGSPTAPQQERFAFSA